MAMDYKLLLDTAVFAGEILMKNGAETYRVEDTMYRILRKSELRTVEVLVMMTGFVVTLDDPSMDSLTVVRRITKRGMDLEKIDCVNSISREFCEERIPLPEAFRQMKKLWKMSARPQVQFLPMAALTGGIAVMFGGNWIEGLIAAVTGLAVALVLYLCKKGNVHMFLENMLASIAVAVVVSLILRMVEWKTGIQYDKDLLIVSGIMPMVPGAAITNAVFDTIHGDYLSGVARGAEAFVIALSVATGIGIGLFLV